LSPETVTTVRETLIAMKANVLTEFRCRPAEAATAAATAALPSPPPRPAARVRAAQAEPEFQQDRP
jgi:hypothetical protein